MSEVWQQGDNAGMCELRGCLRDFGLVPLVRFVAERGKRGCLSISQADLVGELVFDDGRVVAAVFGEERGLAALDLIALALADGDFVYTDNSPPALEPNIASSFTDVQVELEKLPSRQWLRGARSLLRSVPHVAHLRDDSTQHTVTLRRSELEVLLAVDGRHTTQEIVHGRDPGHALHTLTRLSKAGIIELDAPNEVTVVSPQRITVARPALAAGAPTREMTWKSRIRTVAQVVILTTVFVLALRAIVQSVHVQGESMLPGLKEGELLLVSRVAYLFGRPQRGDVVVFESPNPADGELVKRVVGLPGDEVRIEQRSVFVDDQLLNEPYVASQGMWIDPYPPDGQSIRVPDNSYFVLGDNRGVSLDSRQGWFVRADQLIGRASVIYWPPDKWGLVPQPVVAANPRSAAVVESQPTPVAAVPTVVAPPVPTRVVAPTPIIEPTEQQTTPMLRTLLTGFVKDQAGWPSDPNGPVWFDGNFYRLASRQPTRFVAVAAPVEGTYANVVVTAAFHKVGGPPGGGYGIIARDEGPGPRDGLNQGGRFYLAEAGDRGEFSMWRRENDHWVDILPWTPSDAVHAGGTTNELTLRAVGVQLTFIVNGIQAATLVDDALPSGRLGVYVGGDGNDVVLDRFTVQLPAAVER